MKSRLLNMVWAGALSALLGATGAPAWATPVTNPGGNSSVATAFNLDGSFSLEFEANIESGDGTNESTTIPHVTVNAVSEVGQLHFYAFTVAGAGTFGIFDIDNAEINGLDSYITLYDTDGVTVLAENDDSPFDGPGDNVTPGTFNSFLTFSFPAPGVYFLEVAECCVEGFPLAAPYQLHVSLGATTPPSTLVSSVLPASRSVQVGSSATAFATIINADTVTAATGCSIAPLTSVPAGFSYQTTDPATNALIGTPDTPVDIAAGALQTFLFAFTPTAEIAPTDVQLSYDCTNTEPAAVTPGLNTLLLSASATPVPDIVALGATPTGDGTLRLPGVGGSGAFAVASVNVGSSDTITATPGFGSASLPVALSICETNPATGACLGAAAASVTTSIAAGATPTFAIFATATADVAFDPASSRIFVSFTDAGGITRGSTSVAVTTAP
jgi:hypothetical protein